MDRHPSFNPIATKKIYQEILSQFVQMIVKGKLRPGDKIPSERLLAESFHVSRPSVREALRVLEIIGLIEIQGGGGAYVKEFDITPFISLVAPLLCNRDKFDLELLEFRELIELHAMELIEKRGCCPNLPEIHQTLLAMEIALQQDDNEQGAVADIAFHRALLRASGSYILQKVLDMVVTLFEHAVRGGRSVVLTHQEDAQQLFQDHKTIYEALASCQFSKASELVASHLAMVKKLYHTT